jgi:hypothetical protein
MTRDLDGLYFEWLHDLVCPEQKTHHKMLDQLFHKEFVWIITNDDNRAADGKELRREFLETQGLCGDVDFMEIGCSMFELLVGLSRRLAFEADGESLDWFWCLVKNVGLYGYKDARRYPAERVDEILDRIIWRTYSPDGRGGLFPRSNPEEDQREVELWYQMSGYLLDLGAY